MDKPAIFLAVFLVLAAVAVPFLIELYLERKALRSLREDIDAAAVDLAAIAAEVQKQDGGEV